MKDKDEKPLLPGWDEGDGAHARREDPATSHAAAAALKHTDQLGDLQEMVRTCLRARPMTIWEACHWARIEIHSLSPRFATLADLGLIRPTGELRENPKSHRKAIVWENTPAGEEANAAAARRLVKAICPTCGQRTRRRA